MAVDFFMLGTTMIFLHELDAVRCSEWRIFPGLALLSDRLGMIVFLFAHVPLVYWILAEVRTGEEDFQYWFNVFLIVHLCLHIVFLKHKNNEFTDWISWSLIVGAAACGFIDILMTN